MAWSTAIEAALRAPAGARFHKCALQVNPFQYEADARLGIEERLAQTLDGNLRDLDPARRAGIRDGLRCAHVLSIDYRYRPRPLMGWISVAKDVAMGIRRGRYRTGQRACHEELRSPDSRP